MAENPGVHEKHVRMADDVKNPDEDEATAQSREGKPSTPKRERKPRKCRKILIAVDGSPASNGAVEWYLDEMHKKRNTVVFLHSFELPLMHSYQEMYSTPETWTATLKHEADRTANMERNLMRKLKVNEIEGKFMAKGGGKPGEAILAVAEEEEVDMIIMGTRGHGKLMRALLGSVSHYVMSHAQCPVLVYREKKGKPRSRSGSPVKGKKEGKQQQKTGEGAQKGKKDKQADKDAKED